MSGRAGVELTPTTVRLVRVTAYTGRVMDSVEIPWSPQQPGEAVATLRAKNGSVQGLSLAIGLGFLDVVRVDVPPVAPPERTKIVELEPDRYFASAGRETLVVTVAQDEPIAFGVPASLVESWIKAFEAWAPVNWVEPSPIALARVIDTRVLDSNASATYQVEAAPGDYGVLRLDHGRVKSIRRTRDKSAVGEARGLPAIGTLAPQFAAALGAARKRAQNSRGAPALVPDEWRHRLAARSRAAIAISTVVAAAAIVFATWAADRWRERTLAALEQNVAQVEARAAAADTALRMLRSREAEAQAIREIAANRADPFTALAAISSALPREANVLSARANGNDWQIDGTTSDASVLVPLLDRHARFDSVRFLSASSRYRQANRSYETFSIALRFRP